jgi:hypothetical protein
MIEVRVTRRFEKIAQFLKVAKTVAKPKLESPKHQTTIKKP